MLLQGDEFDEANMNRAIPADYQGTTHGPEQQSVLSQVYEIFSLVYIIILTRAMNKVGS